MKNTKLKNKILDFVEANEMDNEGKKWGLPLIPDFPVSLLEFGPQPSAPQPFLPSLELRFVSL